MSLLKECLNHRDIKAKIINCISFGTIAVAFVMLIVAGYWLLYPYHPLTINKRPVEIVNKNVSKSKDKIIIYRIDYCKNTKVSPTLKKKYEDGLIYTVPDVELTHNALGCRTENIAQEVPHGLPEGEYILLLEYHYQMNTLRDVVVRTHTEKFYITE